MPVDYTVKTVKLFHADEHPEGIVVNETDAKDYCERGFTTTKGGTAKAPAKAPAKDTK